MRAIIPLIVLLAACSAGGSDPAGPGTSAAPTNEEVPSEGCAHVVDVEVVDEGARAFTFHVTVSSADEGWDKYADEWVVRSANGEVFGTRVLTHPHVDEQPFTRSLRGVIIPDGVSRVDVAARDSVLGFCGDTFAVDLP